LTVIFGYAAVCMCAVLDRHHLSTRVVASLFTEQYIPMDDNW